MEDLPENVINLKMGKKRKEILMMMIWFFKAMSARSIFHTSTTFSFWLPYLSTNLRLTSFRNSFETESKSAGAVDFMKITKPCLSSLINKCYSDNENLFWSTRWKQGTWWWFRAKIFLLPSAIQNEALNWSENPVWKSYVILEMISLLSMKNQFLTSLY